MTRETGQEKKEKLWGAYLDGEMSSAEALDFDNSLSDKERERLVAEKRFEEALADRLTGELECPKELWNQVAAQMRHADRHQRVMPPILWKLVATGAAAACLLLVASNVFLKGRHNSTDPGAIAQHDRFLENVPVAELAQTAEVEGNPATATRYLAARGIPVSIQAVSALVPADSPHHATFLGARERTVGGDRVVDLMWDCCGDPVVISVAAAGTAAAQQIHAALGDGRVRGERRMGGYVAALVSEHAGPGFLDILRPSAADVT